MDTVDLLTDLPDDLLYRILSSLPTKNVAAATALSRRWKSLIDRLTFPHINFDESMLLNPNRMQERAEELNESFMLFVDRWVEYHRMSGLRKFSLKCDRVHYHLLFFWLNCMLLDNVPEIELIILSGLEASFPVPLFTSKALVTLKLGAGQLIIYDTVHLPNLKTLHFYSVAFDETLHGLIHGCPALENLAMENMCWSDHANQLEVSVPSLQRLSIGFLNYTYRYWQLIKFDAPNLISLEYFDIAAHTYILMNLGSLIKAVIGIGLYDHSWEIYDAFGIEFFPYDATQLFKGISNVRWLTLPAETVEVLPLCCANMPLFNNLIDLVIEVSETRGWQGLTGLIRNSPNLQRLVFQGLLHRENIRCGDVCNCKARPDDIASSLSDSPLKTIEMLSFHGSEREIGMINHFLENSRDLEVMIIHCSIEEDRVLEIATELLRISENCVIEILNHV